MTLKLHCFGESGLRLGVVAPHEFATANQFACLGGIGICRLIGAQRGDGVAGPVAAQQGPAILEVHVLVRDICLPGQFQLTECLNMKPEPVQGHALKELRFSARTSTVSNNLNSEV